MVSRLNEVDNGDYIRLTGGQELIDIEEAAACYGCQRDRIQDLIARGMLHPLFDRQEVEELRQKHLYKKVNARSNPRQKRN